MKIVDLFWEGISIIKQAISWYKGSGKLLELFLIMLVLLLILSEKNSFERRIAGYTILSIVVLCNPFVAVILKKIALETVYWRTLWILPMSVDIIVAITLILKKIRWRWLKILLSIIFLGTFSIIGKPVITNENYQDTENKYKIPNEVIKVADIILNDSRREVKVIAPEEISTWIREYSAEIILQYGRGYIYGYNGWNAENDYLQSILNAEVIDLPKLDEVVRLWGYEYLVLGEQSAEIGDVEILVYKFIGSTQQYNVFRIEKGAEE